MPASDGHEAIDDDEILFRRIPASTDWYNPQIDSRPSKNAFRPNQRDITGLSLHRKKHISADECGKSGRKGKMYFVAALRAGNLRGEGMEVVPRPYENDPGHAEIANMTYEHRKTPESMDWQITMASNFCFKVYGPYEGLREV